MPRPPTEAARKARREWYHRNADDQIAKTVARNRAYKQRNFKYAAAAKARPCADCGMEYPWYVMQFDHVRGEKVADVSRLVNNGACLASLQAEIDKCDVVCANCHAARTFGQHPQADVTFI